MKNILTALLLALLFSCSSEIDFPPATIDIIQLRPEPDIILNGPTEITCSIEYNIPELISEANGFVVFVNVRNMAFVALQPAPIYRLYKRQGVFDITIPIGTAETNETEFVFDVVLNRYDYGAYTWLASSRAYTYKFSPAVN